MSYRRPLGCALLVVLTSLALVTSAAAADPTEADRKAARALVLDGRAKLQAGDARGALKAFQAAHTIMGVPTTGLDLARAQAALGLLREARATALEVTRMPPKAGEPSAFTEARPAAAELAEQLAGRTPSLEVRLKGLPAGVTPSVTVDGSPVAATDWKLPQKVNPGEHEVIVSTPGFATEQRRVSLKEGAALPVEITLSPVGATPPAGAGPEAAPSGPSPAGQAEPSEASRGPRPDAVGRQVPAWAWVSGAAGIAALGGGVAFAVDYAGVRSTIARDCPGNVCDPARHDAASIAGLRARWNRDIGLAVGLGAAGLLGVGVGLYGIMTTSREGPRRAHGPGSFAVAASPWWSAQGSGLVLEGRF